MFAVLSTGLVTLGYLQGRYQTLALDVDVGVPIEFSIVEAVFAALSFAGFFLASGGLFLLARHRQRAPEAEADGGHVSAIVPVYGDEGVLHRSVESLVASAYEDLTVWIVPEPDDGPCRERAGELAAGHDRVEVLVNDKYSGSKAGAINYAAEVTDGDLLAVFDADERVDPQFLPAAVAKLDDADVVQGRTVPEPVGLIESVAYYESLVLDEVARRLLYLGTSFRMAASRAVVVTRPAFRETGGYHTEMLTEDFEFAYRCYRNHLDVEEMLAYPSETEAAHSLGDWWGQRKRWMTGYAQSAVHLVGEALSPEGYRDVLSAVIAAGTVGAGLFLLTLFPKFVVLGLVGRPLVAVGSLAAVVAVTLAVQLQDLGDGSVDRIGLTWLAIPLLFPLYSLVAVKALVEYLVSWEGEWYHVTKGASVEAD